MSSSDEELDVDGYSDRPVPDIVVEFRNRALERELHLRGVTLGEVAKLNGLLLDEVTSEPGDTEVVMESVLVRSESFGKPLGRVSATELGEDVEVTDCIMLLGLIVWSCVYLVKSLA